MKTVMLGFRNQQEHDLVIGGQLRTSGLLFGADPAGQLFRGSAQRLAYLRGFRQAVDKDEEETRRELARSAAQRHDTEVRNLMNQGYSRQEAEQKAGH